MDFAANYSETELREFIDQDADKVGGTHPTLVVVSAALCPTTKCTSKC